MSDAAGSVDSTVSSTGALSAVTTAATTASTAATTAAATGATLAAVGQDAIAAVTHALDSVCGHIDEAIARTKSWNQQTKEHHHHGDQFVQAGTNWDSYDLPTLVSMVAAPASPSQVQSVAALWRTNGAAISQGADSLSQSLTTLMNYWQGSASTQVAQSVTNTANWISTVGDTAGKVASLVEDASGALQSAQNTMPGMPTNNFWAAYNTAAGGATVGAPAGPFGVAAGTMMGGLTSVFDASNNQGAMKQQAVQTMQRYEQAAMNIDTGTPRFTAPPTWGTASAGPPSSRGPGLAMNVPGTQGQGLTGQNLTTMPAFADSPTGRWDALTGAGAGGGAGFGGTGGPHGGGFGGGGSAALGLFGGGGLGSRSSEAEAQRATNMSAPGAVAAAGEAPAAGVVGRAGAAGNAGTGAEGGSVMEEVDGRAAGGTAMPMGGMMGGVGGRGGQEQEHRRRIPFDEDPFITGLKAVPPVIGLNATDREADR